MDVGIQTCIAKIKYISWSYEKTGASSRLILLYSLSSIFPQFEVQAINIKLYYLTEPIKLQNYSMAWINNLKRQREWGRFQKRYYILSLSNKQESSCGIDRIVIDCNKFSKDACCELDTLWKYKLKFFARKHNSFSYRS